MQHSNIIASKYMHRQPPLRNSLPDGILTVNKLSNFNKQIRSWLKDIDFNFVDYKVLSFSKPINICIN